MQKQIHEWEKEIHLFKKNYSGVQIIITPF